MLKLEYDKQEILEVIDRIVKRTMKMDLTWDWPCGVAYFGIADAYEKTGNCILNTSPRTREAQEDRNPSYGV